MKFKIIEPVVDVKYNNETLLSIILVTLDNYYNYSDRQELLNLSKKILESLEPYLEQGEN